MELLTPETVARQLSMSVSWVYTHKHKIGFVRLGKSIRFEPDAVREYAEGCKRGPEHEGDKWESLSNVLQCARKNSLRERTKVSDIKARLMRIEKEGNTR